MRLRQNASVASTRFQNFVRCSWCSFARGFSSSPWRIRTCHGLDETAAAILNEPMRILSSRVSNSSMTRSSPQMSPRANASRCRTSTSGSSARSALYLSWLRLNASFASKSLDAFWKKNRLMPPMMSIT